MDVLYVVRRCCRWSGSWCSLFQLDASRRSDNYGNLFCGDEFACAIVLQTQSVVHSLVQLGEGGDVWSVLRKDGGVNVDEAFLAVSARVSHCRMHSGLLPVYPFSSSFLQNRFCWVVM